MSDFQLDKQLGLRIQAAVSKHPVDKVAKDMKDVIKGIVEVQSNYKINSYYYIVLDEVLTTLNDIMGTEISYEEVLRPKKIT
jgi:hypothetical protein